MALILALISTTFSLDGLHFLFIENIKYYILMLLLLPVFLFLNKGVCKIRIFIAAIAYVMVVLILILKTFFVSHSLEVEILAKVLFITPFFFINKIDVVSTNKIRFVLLVFLLFLIVYTYHQGYYMNNSSRVIFNSTDPNISSMYILFAFFLARKIKSKFFISIFLVCGVLTASRNFVLAIAVFYFILQLKNFRMLNRVLSFNFISVFILLNVLVVALSYSFKFIDYDIGSLRDSSRIATVTDESNAIRFKINRDVINILFEEPVKMLFGLGTDYPTNKSYNINYKSHNGLIDLIGMHGVVYTIFLLSVLYYLFGKFGRFSNAEYIYSYAFFSLFLAGFSAGVYLFIILFIVAYQDQVKLKGIKVV